MNTLKISIIAAELEDFSDSEDIGALSENEDECFSKSYIDIQLGMKRTASKCYDDSEVIQSPAPQNMKSPSKFRRHFFN
jgi:hypothetical protein